MVLWCFTKAELGEQHESFTAFPEWENRDYACSEESPNEGHDLFNNISTNGRRYEERGGRLTTQPRKKGFEKM